MKSARVELDKPLQNRVFYLDVKIAQNRSKLADYVSKLGGTVGEFLDKRVRYLITDRPKKDWPTKDKIESCCNDVSLNPSEVPKTPEKQVNRVELLPRGKRVALRANAPSITSTPQSSKTTTDVIELAYRRGLKLLTAQSVLEFCVKYLRDLENPADCDTPVASKSQVKVKQLEGFFIKIEDTEEKFRPSAKEFSEWPEIHLDTHPFISPFVAPPSKVKRLSVEGTVESTKHPETGKESAHEGKAIAATPETKTLNTRRSITTKTIEGLGLITPKLSNRTNDLRGTKPTPKRKSPISMCEICGIEFENPIQEHIFSERHQKHVRNKENYKDLLNVIKSLPKWTEICQNATETGDSSESEAEYEGPSYPSLTPPSLSSTTITLNPASAKVLGGNSNVKGTFLPLHDYIAIQSRGLHKEETIVREKEQESNNQGKLCPEQLFGDDDEAESNEVEASCLTPPLLPPLIYHELDIPAEQLTHQGKTIVNEDMSIEF